MRQLIAKSGRASLGAALLVVGSGFLGCTSGESGSIDIAKSKSIAAEKGIGPGAHGGPGVPKPTRPTSQPNAPSLPPGR